MLILCKELSRKVSQRSYLKCIEGSNDHKKTLGKHPNPVSIHNLKSREILNGIHISPRLI